MFKCLSPVLTSGLRSIAVMLIGAYLAALTTPASAQTGPSGLPLPRFATTRSDPINVRVGPGTKYAIAWTYVKAGQPVEIIQEFDTWRKIRDVDGSEGWVHQNLLTGVRSAIVAPWSADGRVALLKAKAEDGGVRAWLPAGLRVGVDRCDGTYCLVNASGRTETGSASSFTGYLPQGAIWGAYLGETFD
jgi:SH3-like domain-containing protein